METYREAQPLWDFTSAASGFSQMPDIDFMSLLDKQYQMNPANPTNNAGQPSSLPGLSLNGTYHAGEQNDNQMASGSRESSSDDLPSPSDSHDSRGHDEPEGPAGKRKAVDDAQEGPSSKSMKGSAPTTSTSGRRKSTGNPAKDESRLLKRKEQNRAAQRAFRERKEKHVKDLEDKVAQLEAKNEEAQHENENLRDLLSRLQSENVMLKQSQFTFSMPRDSMPQQQYPADVTSFPQEVPSPSPFAAPSSSKSPNLSNPLDWSSLTTFDPSRLNLLDDLSQPTATGTAMNLDFGFGPSGLASNTPFTTLASNPMFMSFASSFDSPASADSPSTSTSTSQSQPFNFDMNSLTSWPITQSSQEGSLDDLLQGYLGPNNNLDFTPFMTSPGPVSPVNHHVSPSGAMGVSSSSSPSSSSTDPLFTPKDSPRHELEGNGEQCPKTKAEFVKRIEEAGPSPFAPSCNAGGVRKAVDNSLGAMISCEGATSFPKTQKNESNIEVLSAWRSITSNPKFKDTDISELCAEFTAKARCDGTKVVLEPSSVNSIMESLSKKQQQSSPSPQQ